jgi:hypothetical protein
MDGRMKNRKADELLKEMPFLYYRTKGEIEDYCKKPVKLKLQWLEAQMEFFHKAMPQKAKRIREILRKPDLRLSIRGTSLSREILKERKQSKR